MPVEAIAELVVVKEFELQPRPRPRAARFDRGVVSPRPLDQRSGDSMLSVIHIQNDSTPWSEALAKSLEYGPVRCGVIEAEAVPEVEYTIE